jgi:hypothetical protein
VGTLYILLNNNNNNNAKQYSKLSCIHLDYVITFLMMLSFIDIYHTGLEILCGQMVIGNGITT